jgi:hypothetical protein
LRAPRRPLAARDEVERDADFRLVVAVAAFFAFVLGFGFGFAGLT